MPTVETNGIETYYEDYGEGQPIVVLHGATADHQVWAEQLQPLTDDYRILLYDLRGHGKTGGSDHDRYTIDMYVDDLAAFIDTLDLDRPIVLGHSMGGMISYTFAGEYPELLSALATVGAMTPEQFSIKERVSMGAMTNIVYPLMGNERVLTASMWSFKKLFGDDAVVDMDELQEIRDTHPCDAPDLPASEHAKIMAAVRGYFGSSWSWQLSGTPTLLLYGENEPFIESHANYLKTQLAECRTAEIPDASHNAQVENPEFIRTRIQQFVDEVVDDQKRTATTPAEQGE